MKNNKKGFTLVELLAVIVILGVLLVIAVPAVTNIQTTSKQKAAKDGMLMFLKAIETYEVTGDGNLSEYYEGTVNTASCLDASNKVIKNCAYWDATNKKVIFVLEGYGASATASSLSELKGKVQAENSTTFAKVDGKTAADIPAIS